MAKRSRDSLRGGETVLQLIVKKRPTVYFTFVTGMVCKSYINKTITNTHVHKQRRHPDPALPEPGRTLASFYSHLYPTDMVSSKPAKGLQAKPTVSKGGVCPVC